MEPYDANAGKSKLSLAAVNLAMDSPNRTNKTIKIRVEGDIDFKQTNHGEAQTLTTTHETSFDHIFQKPVTTRYEDKYNHEVKDNAVFKFGGTKDTTIDGAVKTTLEDTLDFRTLGDAKLEFIGNFNLSVNGDSYVHFGQKFQALFTESSNIEFSDTLDLVAIKSTKLWFKDMTQVISGKKLNFTCNETFDIMCQDDAKIEFRNNCNTLIKGITNSKFEKDVNVTVNKKLTNVTQDEISITCVKGNIILNAEKGNLIIKTKKGKFVL